MSPGTEVMDAIKEFVAAGIRVAEDLEQHHEAGKRADEILTRELTEFKKRSKN
jgi:hypothetical protein